MYLSCGFYFRQERRIACSAEKGEQNGEKQQGGYELCKGKKYTVSDVSKAERHNERKNETYENINMIEERIPYNVHFKKPFAPTYMVQLKQMETDGLVSLRWVGKMNNIRACADEIVLNDIVYS